MSSIPPDGLATARWPDDRIPQEPRLKYFTGCPPPRRLSRANGVDRIDARQPQGRKARHRHRRQNPIWTLADKALKPISGIDAAAALRRLGLRVYKLGADMADRGRRGFLRFAKRSRGNPGHRGKARFHRSISSRPSFTINPAARTVRGSIGKFGRGRQATCCHRTAGSRSVTLSPRSLASRLMLSRHRPRPAGQAGGAPQGSRREPAPRRPGAHASWRGRPIFCSGCPHNTSTVVPEGSEALAGIGCHSDSPPCPSSTDRAQRHLPIWAAEGGILGRPMAPFTDMPPCLPKPRRRDLLPFGPARRSGRPSRRKVNMTYQNPVQRRRGDDRRATGRRPAQRCAQITRQVHAEGVEADRSRDRRARTNIRLARAFRPEGVRIQPPGRARHGFSVNCAKRRVSPCPDLRPDLRRRETPSAQAGRLPGSRAAGSSLTSSCARAAAIAASKIELPVRGAHRDREFGRQARKSTNRPATRTISCLKRFLPELRHRRGRCQLRRRDRASGLTPNCEGSARPGPAGPRRGRGRS